jgi:hypothetical protein
MSKVGYSINTEGAVALSAGVAKSILGAQAQAAAGLQLDNFEIAFDGVSASGVPVLVELCYATFATNAPGTNSTLVTVDQLFGRALAAGLTAGRNWTTEPTVLTPVREWLLTPNAGLVMFQYPLGQEPDSAFSQGYVFRLNAPANVNVRASMGISRI